MAMYDPQDLMRQQPPIMGASAPNYAPIPSLGGNQQLATMLITSMVPYLQSMMGRGQFLPQQYPAQQIMDQMTSAKYQRDSLSNAASVGHFDQAQILNRMLGVRSAFDPSPVSDMSRAHLNNFAGYINSPIGQMIASMTIGPQNAEDLFFGRRGSAVQLANSVNQLGFYRSDSVTGADRMSGESLQQFTEQLYSNLYGPKANLNDVSGFSAGRVGTLATELAQRGMLPASLSQLSDAQQLDVFQDKTLRPENFAESIAEALAERNLRTTNKKFGDKTYFELSVEEQREAIRREARDAANPFQRQADAAVNAMDTGKSFEEVREMEGGDVGIRKLDASRVGNALKQYTGAVDAVREIFGANGMGSAPMQQLIAALEALTQNSVASMSPGKIENIMRRTQMAARDAGVSLEALMGLSARGGALADQFGLVRDVVPENVIAAMERGRAMRDVGAFDRPGFGKMDANKAVLFGLDQTMRADASPVSRRISVARRIVEENKNNAQFNNRAQDLISFVQALERGDTTFQNAAGETVNMYEQMGRRPGEFFSNLFESAGVSDAQVSALLYDAVNTQEFLVAGATMPAQAVEVKDRLHRDFMSAAVSDTNFGAGMAKDQRQQLGGFIGRALSEAVIDQVDSNMAPEERIAVLKDAARSGLADYVRQQDPTADAATVNTEVDRLVGTLFTDDKAFTDFISIQQANAGRFVESRYRMNINQFRQVNSMSVNAATQQRRKRNMARANVADAMSMGSDGSNLLQRVSDFFIDPNGGDALNRILGGIDTDEGRQAFIDAMGGKDSFDNAMTALKTEYSDATFDTKEEKEREMLNPVLNAGDQAASDAAFAAVKDKYAGITVAENALRGKTGVTSTATVQQNLEKLGANGDERLQQLYRAMKPGQTYTNAADAAKELAADPTLRAFLQDRELADDVVGADRIMETEFRDIVANTTAFAGATPEERRANQAKLQRLGVLQKGLDTGTVRGKNITDVFGGDANLEQAIDTTIEKGADTAAMTEFEKALNASGLDANKVKQVRDVTRLSGVLKNMGGLTELGGSSTQEQIQRASRATALQEMVNDGKIKADSDLGKVITRGTAADAKPEEKKKLRELVADMDESGSEFQKMLEADGTKAANVGTAEINREVQKRAQSIEQSQSAATTSGPLAAIGGAIKDALVTAFKDVKIENVTITNLKTPGVGEMLGGLWNSIAQAAGGEAVTAADAAKQAQSADLNTAASQLSATPPGPVDLQGTLKITGLESAIAEFQAENLEPTQPGAPPVAPTGRGRGRMA